MCYSALTIARYFIEKSGGTKTPLQLNKLAYIAHGWCLAIYDRPLIVEDIEAWKYGPVVPEMYYAFKKYGGNPVPYMKVEDVKSINEDDRRLLDRVFDEYGKYNGVQLSAMTHQKGTPWTETRKFWRFGANVIIRNSVIKKYYQEKAKITQNE